MAAPCVGLYRNCRADLDRLCRLNDALRGKFVEYIDFVWINGTEAEPRGITSLSSTIPSRRNRGRHHDAFLVRYDDQQPDTSTRVPAVRSCRLRLPFATDSSALMAMDRAVHGDDRWNCNAGSPSLDTCLASPLLAVGVNCWCKEARSYR